MIRRITEGDLEECARLVRESFGTVAEAFGLTEENAPRFTAFSVTHERLTREMKQGKQMFGFEEEGRIIAFYTLSPAGEGDCELGHLCVLPGKRHAGIGGLLLTDALHRARKQGYSTVRIGIVEENQPLRSWYERHGFVHTGVWKPPFFPFTCGYMAKCLVRIRPMVPEDYDRVFALWMSCKNMGFNDLDDSREGIEKYLARNPSSCFAAEAGQALVGVILAGHDGRRGMIHHLAVEEGHRRQGIASALVEEALAALKAEGIHKAALLVFNRNAAGNAFWESMGFSTRTDVTYRNRALAEMVRIDT